ncbi:hypothetical protein ACSQ67_002471 [Phaseolus vulgaris]
MQTMWLRLSNSDTKSLIRLSSYLYSSYFPTPLSFISLSSPCRASSTATNLFASPWSSSQHRGIKVSGSDIRVGNIIGKQGSFAIGLLNFTEVSIRHVCFLTDSFCILIVLDMLASRAHLRDHSHEGRGKATIKVELRDIGQGNKVTQRMGTNDDIERVYVQVKTFMFMCMDRDGTVVLMDPDTLDQMEVSKDLFNKDCLYLRESPFFTPLMPPVLPIFPPLSPLPDSFSRAVSLLGLHFQSSCLSVNYHFVAWLADEMKVKVQFYDDKPLSASVPKRVSCIVKEVIAATPRNKKVVLDNGLTIEMGLPSDASWKDWISLNTAYHLEQKKNGIKSLFNACNTKCLFCLINYLQVPPHIVPGDAIVVNTEDDSYIERLVGVI